MKHIRITILVIVALLMIVQTTMADDTLIPVNAKAIGKGNARIAGAFTYNGFLDNPALLSRVQGVRFAFANVPIGINENLVDVAKFIDKNSDNFADFDSLSTEDKDKFLDDMNEFDGKWGRVSASPTVSLAANILGYGIGIAVYNTTNIALKIDKGIYEPRVWGEGYAGTAYVVGLSKPLFMLYPGLTVGVNLKYLERRKASLFNIPASDLGRIEDTIEPVNEEIKDNKNRNFAIDVGALLDLPLIGAEVGATMHSIGDGRGASLDLGIAKRMYGERLILVADYVDFFDNNRENIFNKLHFGAEYRAALLALRAGINKGYPSLGAGLNFRVIDIDYAWYTEELSKGPGGNAEGRHLVQIKIGWF